MGMGDMLKKAKFLNKAKNINIESVFDLYQKKLEDAKKSIEHMENELEEARTKGDVKRVKKLEKKLKKMKFLTEKVEKDIAEGITGFAGKVRT